MDDVQRRRDRETETAAGWPTSHEMITQLREVVGLPTCALPISPRQAWEEALEAVRSYRDQAYTG